MTNNFEVTRLSGLGPPAQPFSYIRDPNLGSQEYNALPDAGLWPHGSTSSGDNLSTSRKKSKRHSKKRSKHRSKSHKNNRKHRLGAYVLQLIGLFCLVLAAVKSFEPLTGVGFTLILIGYNDKKLKENALAGRSSFFYDTECLEADCKTDLFNRSQKKSESRSSGKRRERKRIKEEVEDVDSDMED